MSFHFIIMTSTPADFFQQIRICLIIHSNMAAINFYVQRFFCVLHLFRRKLHPSIWNYITGCFRSCKLCTSNLPQLLLPVKVCVSAYPCRLTEILDVLPTLLLCLYHLRQFGNRYSVVTLFVFIQSLRS